MKAIKRLTIAGGKYVKDGETKTRWVDIGTMFQKDNGTYTILLNAGINLAVYSSKEEGHEGEVWANLFDLRDKTQQPAQPKPVIVDDVPF